MKACRNERVYIARNIKANSGLSMTRHEVSTEVRIYNTYLLRNFDYEAWKRVLDETSNVVVRHEIRLVHIVFNEKYS